MSKHCYERLDERFVYLRAFLEGREKSIEDLEKISQEAYKIGLNDGWKLGKKITIPAMYGGLGAKECADIFGENIPGMEIFQKYSVEEVVAKFEAYEQKKQQEQAEIKAGDIVIYDGVEKVVLFKDFTDNCYIWNGNAPTRLRTDLLVNTGKHIDFQEVLSKLEA